MLFGESAGGGGVSERDERLARVDAPRDEAGVADAELVPARGGGEQVGVCVGVAVLSEPQSRAVLQQQRAGEGAGWRIAALAGGGQRGVGGVGLVELGEGVDEGVQREDDDGWLPEESSLGANDLLCAKPCSCARGRADAPVA